MYNPGTDTFSEFEYSTMNFKKFREELDGKGQKPLSGTVEFNHKLETSLWPTFSTQYLGMKQNVRLFALASCIFAC